MKLEHRLAESTLEEELERYKSFRGLLPKVYWYGWQDDFKVMAFELLGPSLEDLFVFCDHRLSLKTALMIMDQLLSRFEALHSKGVVHQDVKPQNCLLGAGKNGNVVHLTDFGLAGDEMTSVEEEEDFHPTRPQLVGTTRYASIRGRSGQGACGD